MVDAGGWRPRLREEVSLERAEDGRVVAIVDPLLARRLPAGPLTASLAARLAEGGATVAELVADAAGRPCREREGALRVLLLLNLIEGAGDEVRAAVRAAQAEEAPAPRTLPQARFGCLASGQCCQVYRPGPLTEADLARLAAAGPALRVAFPELPPEPWTEERPGDDGAVWTYLRRVEGRCVFLRPERRCGVHAVAGREQKPEACRLFPFDAVRTIAGLAVYDVSQCSAFAEAALAGPAHVDAAPEVAALLRPALHHPLVALGPAPADYGHVAPLVARCLELARERELGERLRACAAAAREHAAALAACPLVPGEPQATAAACAARPVEPLPVAAADAAALALVATGDALGRALAREDEGEAPLAEVFREELAAATALLADRAGLAADPLPPALLRARDLPLDRAAADAALRASLQNRLFGAKLLVAGSLRAGILRLALVELATLAGARVDAAVEGAARVEARHLSAGHWAVSLALARPRVAAALLEVEAHAWTLAAAVPLLCGEGAP
ncbi:MAG: YkgJ family cysteine cluster protein [Planctomycetota bacterium]